MNTSFVVLIGLLCLIGIAVMSMIWGNTDIDHYDGKNAGRDFNGQNPANND